MSIIINLCDYICRLPDCLDWTKQLFCPKGQYRSVFLFTIVCLVAASVILQSFYSILAQNLCMLQATPSYRSGLCWWSSYIFPYSSFSLVLGLQGNQIDKTLEVIVQQTKHQQEVQWYTGRQTRNIATWLWNCMCRSGVLRAHFLKFHKLVLRQTEVDWLWKCLQKDIMPSFRSSLLKNIISLILPMNA